MFIIWNQRGLGRMSHKNDTTVLIGGNVYTLAGTESEEYIQRVALYINNKLEEIRKSDNAKKLNTRLMSILLDINIADDFFKAKVKIEELEKIIKAKDDTITNLEQDVISLQVKLEELDGEKSKFNQRIEALKTEIDSYKAELDEYIEIFDHEKAD
ncbi:MAG: cell division protein ZapA [Firmicutes bacterium HGW-Firmicutes-1]|jgi:cell division protein ZapA|nr:MAG: cell division protein ZapA [Firmicutes bacterium HGW-Firmicutes-1]